MPQELHDFLVEQAKRQERSLNSHIVYILRTYHSQEPANGGGLPGELMGLDITENQEVGGADGCA